MDDEREDDAVRRAVAVALAATLVAALVAFQAPGAVAATASIKHGDCDVAIQSYTLDKDSNTYKDDGSDQGKADTAAVKDTIKNLLDKSPDFVKKLEDACKKHGKKLNIRLFRNTSRAYVASAQTKLGQVAVDLGDIAGVDPFLEGKPVDKAKLKANLLAFFLAHEIDHLRETDTESHDDPAEPGAGVIGPPDEDANKVMADLGVAVSRNDYGQTGSDGKVIVTFTVDGQKVTLHATDANAAQKPLGGGSTQKTVTPGTVKGIPDEPCPSSPPCYKPADRSDADADGVKDAGTKPDNCPGVANPQQGDGDHDGTGLPCDLDDDGDGFARSLERVTGSSDLCKKCLPESWAVTTSCSNSLDDDRDGFTDGTDQSCLAPSVDAASFPETVVNNEIYPDTWRLDLGGVPEDSDVLVLSGQLLLDRDLDGTPDDQINLQGTLSVDRQAPATVIGTRQMTWSVPDASITGASAGLGNVTVSLSQAGSGFAQDSAPLDGGDFPAQLMLGLPLNITGPGLDGTPGTSDDVNLHTQGTFTLAGTATGWPPFGANLTSPGPGQLLDAADVRRADLLGANLTIQIPP